MNSGLETIEIPKTMKVSLRLFLSDGQNAPSGLETPKQPLGSLIRNFASTKLNKIFILFNYLYLITASPIWQEVFIFLLLCVVFCKTRFFQALANPAPQSLQPQRNQLLRDT